MKQVQVQVRNDDELEGGPTLSIEDAIRRSTPVDSDDALVVAFSDGTAIQVTPVETNVPDQDEPDTVFRFSQLFSGSGKLEITEANLAVGERSDRARLEGEDAVIRWAVIGEADRFGQAEE